MSKNFEFGPVFDPESVRDEAMKHGLIVRRANPLNCEIAIDRLNDAGVTPTSEFYIRNHFDIPRLSTDSFRLRVGGAVDNPLELNMRELRAMPTHSLVATLECAGNARQFFEPAIAGEPWEHGAVSTAKWTGVGLLELVAQARVRSSAREILLRGADGGSVEGRSNPIRFERSLKVDAPQLSEAILAFAMNDAPLPAEHGHPLRLVVPGWYSMTSVKWLSEIELIDHHFDGFFQDDRYWYQYSRAGRIESEPVTLQRVHSLIVEPQAGKAISRGEIAIRGLAWSGAAPIARVEVSVCAGAWREARLVGESLRYGWRGWEIEANIETPGPIELRVRATDAAGNSQPDRAEWNRLGYGNNSIQRIRIMAT
jgi:DMSO/TMAO reductase YedYZ molybdopterin-dependent catalytic subunit